MKGERISKAKQMSRRGRNCQSKGRKWQKYFADILAMVTGMDPDDVYSNQGGDKGDEDVHRSAKMKRAFPFWVECKNTQTLQIPGWWRKLNGDREKVSGADPGIIVSRLYGTSEALVTMSLVDFLNAMYGPLSPSQIEEIRQRTGMSVPRLKRTKK